MTAGVRAGATAQARRRCRSCPRQPIGDRHARPTVTCIGRRPARWPGPDRRAGFQPAPRLLHHAALGAAGLVTAARAGRPHGLWATKNRHDAARSGPAGAGWRGVTVSPIRVSNRLALCSSSPVRVMTRPSESATRINRTRLLRAARPLARRVRVALARPDPVHLQACLRVILSRSLRVVRLVPASLSESGLGSSSRPAAPCLSPFRLRSE